MYKQNCPCCRILINIFTQKILTQSILITYSTNFHDESHKVNIYLVFLGFFTDSYRLIFKKDSYYKQ